MIAMSIATLCNISGGRAQLGLGVGGSGISEMRLQKERPVRALREAIEIIRLMHSGQRVSYSGDLFQLQDAILQVPPLQERIPISIATHGSQILALAGRTADGVLLGNMGTRDAIEDAATVVNRASLEAGLPEKTVTINVRLEAIITEHSTDAMEVMRSRMAHRLISSFPHWAFLGKYKEQLDPRIEQAAGERDRTRVASLLSDDDVRTQALVGTPSDVISQLGELLTDSVDRITIRPYGVGSQGQEATVRSSAEEVWPDVIRRAAAVASPLPR
jgi:5,10-methylenetetrahydromethanopterin reductase